jgi:hypothetical protein
LRIANLFLATGYFVFFFVSFLKSLSVEKTQSGGLFSLTFLAGISPTLVANNVNAGSPFRTTYPPGDVLVFDPLSSAYYYFTDTQGALVALAISLAVYALLTTKAKAIKIVCCIVAINISVNLAFFLTITYTTQYYLLPFTMLSCWSILFALLREDRQQAAMACR